MPELVMILWLPATIAFMAVTYVLTLGAVATTPSALGEGSTAEEA